MACIVIRHYQNLTLESDNKMKKITIIFSLLFLSVICNTQELKPFHIDWKLHSDSAIDLTFLHDAPAGKDGQIRIENGHFVKPDRKRFRIWGINFSSRACFTSKQDAPMIAEYLARMGLNCVRFHHMDNPGTGLLNGDPNTTRELHPDVLDRLDFLIAELKKRGIYTNLNLNVSRQYKEGDDVREFEYLGYAKGVTYFDKRIIELQKEYAEQLLTHYNPYTKSEYRNEPAVVIVEIVNENSIVESWFNNRLLGENTKKNPGTWTDIPPSYGSALTELYNTWLKENLTEDELKRLRKEVQIADDEMIPRLRREQFHEASTFHFHTEASFYMDIEKNYFLDMYDFLKKDLQVQAAIVGSSDHNHYRSGYPHLSATSLMDVVDGHVYWQHPHYTGGRTGRRRNFTIPNTPMVNDPHFSTVVQLSRTAMAGKPYTVSEVNHPYPNEYACEGVPILAAYAMLQDWDGIFWYTFEHATPDSWENRMRGHFDFRPDPVKMASIASTAITFLRNDVNPAKKTVSRSYSRDQVIDSLLLSSNERPYFTPGFSLSIPLIHSTRIESLHGEQTDYSSDETPSKIVSDTGELVWLIEKENKGMVTVNTPHSQSLIGFVKEHPVELMNLSAVVENEFCAIHCVSLDGKPISRAKRMLLTATSKALNSGTVWNDNHTSLEDWGGEPMRVEPVMGTILLKDLKDAANVLVSPLDERGIPVQETIVAKKEKDQWEFPIGVPTTVWYMIQVR